MKKTIFSTLAIAILIFASCSNDDDGVVVIDPDPNPDPQVVIEVPDTYSFERDGESTVNFPGQTQRILMGEELISYMLDFDTATEQSLLDMYANENTPFGNDDLNASSRQLRNTVASSEDYFKYSLCKYWRIRIQSSGS